MGCHLSNAGNKILLGDDTQTSISHESERNYLEKSIHIQDTNVQCEVFVMVVIHKNVRFMPE